MLRGRWHACAELRPDSRQTAAGRRRSSPTITDHHRHASPHGPSSVLNAASTAAQLYWLPRRLNVPSLACFLLPRRDIVSPARLAQRFMCGVSGFLLVIYLAFGILVESPSHCRSVTRSSAASPLSTTHNRCWPLRCVLHEGSTSVGTENLSVCSRGTSVLAGPMPGLSMFGSGELETCADEPCLQAMPMRGRCTSNSFTNAGTNVGTARNFVTYATCFTRPKVTFGFFSCVLERQKGGRQNLNSSDKQLDLRGVHARCTCAHTASKAAAAAPADT